MKKSHRLLPSLLPISSYVGSPSQCGQAHGEEHREGIRIGIETRQWTPRQLKYVQACMKTPWRFQRQIDGFTQGMAQASGKSYLEIAQNYCHEELGRMKHCTAIGATGPGTRSGQPIIGMNWDDGVMDHYAWARLIRLKLSGWPAMLLYSPYPGIWSGAGINEHGVSLVWTSADHRVRKRHKWPVVGVPTYALIAGILACRSSGEVRKLLRETQNAGGFIFFVADADGDVMVVEAVPGRGVVVPCDDVLARANHLEDPDLVRRSGQVVPSSTPKHNSAARGTRVHRLVENLNGRIDAKAVEAILRDCDGKPGLTICQSCENGNPYMTLDSFYCLPAKRELWIARGVPSRHRYQRVPVVG